MRVSVQKSVSAERKKSLQTRIKSRSDLQGFSRPRVELVDDSAVHEAREASGPGAERVAHGRERQHDVQVSLHLGHEEVDPGLGHVWDPRGLGLVGNGAQDVVNVLLGKEVWDPAARDDAVNVD